MNSELVMSMMNVFLYFCSFTKLSPQEMRGWLWRRDFILNIVILVVGLKYLIFTKIGIIISFTKFFEWFFKLTSFLHKRLDNLTQLRVRIIDVCDSFIWRCISGVLIICIQNYTSNNIWDCNIHYFETLNKHMRL